MVTQSELNNIKTHLNSGINDANEIPQESMEINEINISILSACKESIEGQLTNYDKNDWIDSLEENEENNKNVADTGERVINKLKGIILEFKHHMESIEKEKTRQFEEIIRKERLELEKQEHEREWELKKTEMELAYREKMEIEWLQVEKFRLQNEKELKCTEIEKSAKESNQQNSG